MLQLCKLTKKYGAFTALESLDFAVEAGEIVALLGENGAGKSTTIGLISGEIAPDGGEILWQNQPTKWNGPRAAAQAGIGVVHQHFKLVPSFTIAENLALHHAQDAVFRKSDWENRARDWANSLGWPLDPARKIEELSVGERQRVEILKALFAGGQARNQLLLLDEPTANLTPLETAELFAVLRKLKAQGLGIVFVSHKLREVEEICDRVVVLRHGKLVGEREIGETNAQELAALMVGRETEETAPRESKIAARTNVGLKIENLSSGQLRDFSLEVFDGEIVGIAGVDGNGQSELMAILCGLVEPQSGCFEAENSLALIPADRQHEGLILSFDVAQNFALHPKLREENAKFWGLDWRAIQTQTRDLMAQFDIRAPATMEKTPVRKLSGGNQQKIVIARALALGNGAIVAADPTRGLDVGASQFVHAQLRQAAQNGRAVLVVSSDLDEILGLCDRVGVLFEGRLLPHGELLENPSREEIGALMGGKS